ncbi:DUF7134 domain-containing protein [Nocardioides sp. AN3]
MSTTLQRRQPARARLWLERHPAQADVLLAAIVFCMTLDPLVGGSSDLRFDLGWPAFLLVVPAACACLVVRRRLPWCVWATATAFGLVGVALSQGLTPASSQDLSHHPPGPSPSS